MQAGCCMLEVCHVPHMHLPGSQTSLCTLSLYAYTHPATLQSADPRLLELPWLCPFTVSQKGSGWGGRMPIPARVAPSPAVPA